MGKKNCSVLVENFGPIGLLLTHNYAGSFLACAHFFFFQTIKERKLIIITSEGANLPLSYQNSVVKPGPCKKHYTCIIASAKLCALRMYITLQYITYIYIYICIYRLVSIIRKISAEFILLTPVGCWNAGPVARS